VRLCVPEIAGYGARRLALSPNSFWSFGYKAQTPRPPHDGTLGARLGLATIERPERPPDKRTSAGKKKGEGNGAIAHTWLGIPNGAIFRFFVLAAANHTLKR